MTLRVLALLLLLPFCAACSAYRPLKNGVGFSEIPLGPDSYQVTFAADADMAIAEARQYALTRAAELAVLRDAAYFQITNERIYIFTGTQYWPGTTHYESYPTRRGWIYSRAGYEPGYLEPYAIPEVIMTIRLAAENAPNAIPASYILSQAQQADVPLSPGVADRLKNLPPITQPVTLPAPPAPTTKPASQ